VVSPKPSTFNLQLATAKPRRRYHLKFGGVMYVGVCGFIGIAAIQSQTNLLFWIFGLMLGGLIVSGMLSGSIMMGLRVHRLAVEDGAVDEPLVIHYQLSNLNRLVPCFGLVVRELVKDKSVMRGVPEGWVLHIAPGATVQAETIAYPARRGVVELQRVQVTTTFPFGILKKSITIKQPTRLLIYPRLYRIRRELLAAIHAHDPTGGRAGDRAGGDEEYFGLRDYRAGDSLRLVHWKRTAKTHRLVTREMTRQRPDRLMIQLDLRSRQSDWLMRAERAISFAASLSTEGLLAGYKVGLAVLGARFTPIQPLHSRLHRKHLLEALAQIDLTNGRPEDGDVPQVPEANWLIIHAGPVDNTIGPERAMHLTDGDIERWTTSPAPPPASATGAGP
jgi:uncharacterized protein (DUF58 family)